MKNLGLLLVLVVLIFGMSTAAFYAERNNGIPDVFQILFPEKFIDQEAEQARNTQMAPFAAAENAANPVQIDPAIQYDPLGEHVSVEDTLGIAHLPEVAVSKWLQDAIAESLSFSLANRDPHMKGISGFMSENGLTEFQTFLDTTNILKIMESRNYELRGFVTETPELRKAGEAAGVYRWLYDVSVNLTFLPAGTTSYEKLTKEQYRSEFVVLRIQLGRTKKEEGRDGLAIETWAALGRKKS